MESDNYNIDYLRKYGTVTYGLLEPQKEDSVCEFYIEITTPLDPDGRCSARITLHMMDYHHVGSKGSSFEVKTTLGIHELKVLKAFPKLLEILTACGGVDIHIEELCLMLDREGYERTLDDGIHYLPLDLNNLSIIKDIHL